MNTLRTIDPEFYYEWQLITEIIEATIDHYLYIRNVADVLLNFEVQAPQRLINKLMLDWEVCYKLTWTWISIWLKTHLWYYINFVINDKLKNINIVPVLGDLRYGLKDTLKGLVKMGTSSEVYVCDIDYTKFPFILSPIKKQIKLDNDGFGFTDLYLWDTLEEANQKIEEIKKETNLFK